jgi:hypothetical protein
VGNTGMAALARTPKAKVAPAKAKVGYKPYSLTFANGKPHEVAPPVSYQQF